MLSRRTSEADANASTVLESTRVQAGSRREIDAGIHEADETAGAHVRREQVRDVAAEMDPRLGALALLGDDRREVLRPRRHGHAVDDFLLDLDPRGTGIDRRVHLV